MHRDDNPKTLVSTDWLAAQLDQPHLRIIDASWVMPGVERDTFAEYQVAHIPGARFVDIDALSDQTSDLPHMLPPVEQFLSHMRALGVGDTHQVVIYDSAGMFSAPRLWWMFKYFGIETVAVLDGGLPKWRAEQRPIMDETPTTTGTHLHARIHPELLRDAAQVAAASTQGDAQIVDARMPERFKGNAPEPRAGLRSGHIPNSFNLPFTSLLNDDSTMKAPVDLRTAFTHAGVDLSKPIITSCGSGVTAAILALALECIGATYALYDGSWAEWGMNTDLDVETGDP